VDLLNGRKRISTWKQWVRPKEVYQWKSGRSAMELARAWFTSPVPVTPESFRKLLDGHRLTRKLSIQTGKPGKVTQLPERGEGRNHDLVLYGSVGSRKAVVCVEAKVDEELGPMVGRYYREKLKSRSRVPQRIDSLCEILFGDTASGRSAPWQDLRYQLLTGAAGAVLEAESAGADLAVFAVHEFVTDSADRRRKIPRNRKDYEAFVRALAVNPTLSIRAGKMYGPFTCRTPSGQQIELLVGKAVDDWAA
jgi:hypothetical protein